MCARVLACLCLVLLAVAMTTVSGGESTAELFSFEKLAQYTSLASCFAKIHEDFAFCNRKAEEKGRAYLEGVDDESEWAKRVKCCGTWKLRDCWVRAAEKKCDKNQTAAVYRLPYTFVPKLAEQCRLYPAESGKCSFPVALVAGLCALVVAVIAVVVVSIVVVVRRRRQRRDAQLKAAFPEEAEKMKATPA